MAISGHYDELFYHKNSTLSETEETYFNSFESTHIRGKSLDPIWCDLLKWTDGMMNDVRENLHCTLANGRTMNAPPPADSTIMARNFGLTAQNVESQEDLDTRMLS